MYIRQIGIQNLRCFAHTEVSLSAPGGKGDFPNVNVVLGGNGAGKTTLLRALAIGLISPALPSSGFIPFQLVRFSSDGKAVNSVEGVSEVPASPTSFNTLISENGDRESLSHWQNDQFWEAVLEDGGEQFFLCGYSAERRVAVAEGLNDPRFSLRYTRIAGLFEHKAHYLNPIHMLWNQAFPNRLERVISHINELVPHDALEVRLVKAVKGSVQGRSRDRIQLFEGNRRVAFFWRGQEVDYTSLSDGYRAFIGWLADLLYNLLLVCPEDKELTEVPGVVLVDEIDLHLHPEWQRTVVPSISEAFPNLQFVFTTHSPLVAASVPSERLLVMDKRDEDGSSYVRKGEESLYGKMAHQVLEIYYFGLSSTRDERFTEDLHELWLQASSGKNPEASLKIQEMLASPEGFS